MQLTRGVALVLSGRGRTALAQKIAEAHGSWRRISVAGFQSPFDLGSALDDEPDTLIILGAPVTARALRQAVTLTTNNEVIADRKGQEPKIVKAPNLIFCVDEAYVLDFGPEGRRFRVVRL